MVNELVDKALDEGVEPEMLSMWLQDAACNIQHICEGGGEGDVTAGRETLIRWVEDFFRKGPLPGGAEQFWDGLAPRGCEKDTSGGDA